MFFNVGETAVLHVTLLSRFLDFFIGRLALEKLDEGHVCMCGSPAVHTFRYCLRVKLKYHSRAVNH